MGAAPRVAKVMLHYGEEPCLSNNGGSGAVFFCGCALSCVYCQNAAISWDKPREYGRIYSVNELAETFRSLEQHGAQNINLVNATPFLPTVIDALRIASPTIPVVYNTSGYETLETIAKLDGLVNIYLPDYKYSDSSIASRLSGAADYPQTAQAAILAMRDQTGPAVYDSRGAMQCGTIVRHLILPGFIRESIESLNWLADNLPPGTPVSLMGQFTPTARSSEFGLNESLGNQLNESLNKPLNGSLSKPLNGSLSKPLNGSLGNPLNGSLSNPLNGSLSKPLSRESYRFVKAHRAAIGLTDGYNQSPDASGESMIPIWDTE